MLELGALELGAGRGVLFTGGIEYGMEMGLSLLSKKRHRDFVSSSRSVRGLVGITWSVT
jgi:hypothetical protein